jgi:hypothetical protein
MLYERRKFKRFNAPLFIEFNLLKETVQYYVGLTRNFSRQGFCFEFQNYDVKSRENIKFKLRHPEGKFSLHFPGYVVWKEQNDSMCLAGIKFGEMDKSNKQRFLEILSASGNVPADLFLNGMTRKNSMRIKRDKKTAPKVSVREKEELALEAFQQDKRKNISLQIADILLATVVLVLCLPVTIDNFDEDSRKPTADVINSADQQDIDKKQLMPLFDNPSPDSIGEQELSGPGEVHESFGINNRLPQAEKTDAKEMKRETVENVSSPERFEKGSGPEKNIATAQEHRNSGNSNKSGGKVIADSQTGSPFEIGQFVIARSIDNRVPVGIVNVISSSTEKIYCFLEARDVKEDTAVSLVWYHDDKEIASVELPIYRGSRWRTYSSKKLGDLRGNWKVDLQDVNGKVLETLGFTVE